MRANVLGVRKRLNPAQRFMLASFVILVLGMISLGWWVGQRIESGVMHRTSRTMALYVNSFVAPHLQTLGQSKSLTAEDVANLRGLLQDTPLGQQIVAFRVWDASGRILYARNPAMIGSVFPVHKGLQLAWNGRVASEISNLDNAENPQGRNGEERLLETYMPVRLQGSGRIIAVAEFYQTVDDLMTEISDAQQRSWLVFGGVTIFIYLLLIGFVRRVSNTILRQQGELSDQVVRLTELLAQNKELNERVRRAAGRATALNERFLRRISADLHDGPAQDLSLALLRLDHVIMLHEEHAIIAGNGRKANEDLPVIQASLSHAMQEIRSISAGLSLPELSDLTLTETVHRVVRAHERRTGTRVALYLNDLPEQSPLPVKITLYRLIQEALNNAHRHAGGVNQLVRVHVDDDHLDVQVTDQGPGIDSSRAVDEDKHLGLAGMRERVESLGGVFSVESPAGRGTKVIANISLQVGDESCE
jgi:signal transduction histidine kinase